MSAELQELIAVLRKRYAAAEIPPCRVCGGRLTPQSSGGGNAPVYGCSGMEDDPEKPGYVRMQEGRRCGDDHYAQSRWTDYSSGGDSDVLKLCDALATPPPQPSGSEGSEWHRVKLPPPRSADGLSRATSAEKRRDEGWNAALAKVEEMNPPIRLAAGGEGSVPEGFVLVPKEPTDAMLDAGRSAVMARDCSSATWSPRQHFEASGFNTTGIPDSALDGYHSKIPKMQGAALVYYAMLAAAPPQASSGDASMVEVQQATQELGWRREDVRDAARYRWLRRHFKFGNDSLREGWFDACVDSDGNEFDRAIDAAMHPVRGSGGGE